jgi:hypothetical protein
MAGNAIEQFLMQRQLDERKQVEEEFRRAQAEKEMALQQQQEQRIAQAQTEAQANLEKERQFRRAGVIAGAALPGDAVDDPTATLLREQGFGGQIQEAPPVSQVDTLTGVEQQGPAPGILQMRGGSQYMQARMTAQERAAQAAQAQQAAAERAAEAEAGRNERARESNELRALIAGGQSETRALNNQFRQGQIDKQNDDAAMRQRTTDAAKSAALASTNEVMSLIDELTVQGPQGRALKPEAGRNFGMRIPFAGSLPMGETTNAAAKINKLRSKAVLDLIAEMKRQSATGATGFGQMNIKELSTLENGATILNNANISDEAAAAEMARIYETVRAIQSRIGGAPQGQAPAGGGRKYYDANGNPVSR